ncbi:MAG TPA: tetratricopeptide repeat protein, partial [Thermoleophilaceae bacterium]|nr:tetratricopeptide repeat protein [Thermoleophilaceae bacterium]
ALLTATRLFDPERLPVEHAKATNALGAALRIAGRPREAADAFARAAAAFEAAGLTAEYGAASFNLGLVKRESGDLGSALESFERARKLLEEGRLPAQAAAAAREAGATRFAAGDLDWARRELERSIELAARGGDEPGIAAAANALGLVHLHAGRAGAALEALRSAAGREPRAVRPDGYAMVKANLALAYEQAGDHPRARLAARQALGTPQAPEPVAEQASAVIDRLGGPPGDLVRLLEEEPSGRWPALVGEELARWVDADPEERSAEAGAWIDGQAALTAGGVDVAEAMVGALLELPPEDMEAVIGSLLGALGERDEASRERFRSEIDQAMARFHVPQLMRLTDELRRIGAQMGVHTPWS